MVAIIRQYDPQVVEQRSPVVPVQATRSAADGLGEAMQDFGSAAWRVEEHIATAHAYQVDADWANFMRETMHGDGSDGSGYLNSRGMDAVNGREALLESVQARYAQMVESLNPLVRPATVRSLEARYQTFLGQVNNHAAAQARAATAGAAASRSAASREAAIRAGILGDTEGFEMNIAAIEATAADLYPSDEDRQAAYIQENTTDAFRAVAQGIAEEQGMDAAWSFVEANQDRFDTGDLWDMAEAYRDGALEERGAGVADLAYTRALQEAEAARRGVTRDETQPIEREFPSVFNTETPAIPSDPATPRGPEEGRYRQADGVGSPYNTPLSAGMTLSEAVDRQFVDQGLDSNGQGLSMGMTLAEAYDRRFADEAYTVRTVPRVTASYYADVPQPGNPNRTGEALAAAFQAAGVAPPLPVAAAAEPEYVVPPRYVEPDFSAARAQIMEIENPRARQAAIQRLNDLIEQHEADMEEAHTQALTQAREIIVQNGGAIGTVENLPVEISRHLTAVEREQLFGFARTVRENRDPETPDAVWTQLTALWRAGDHQGLLAALVLNSDRISQSDYRTFADRAFALQNGERSEVNWNAIQTDVDRTLRNFGLAPNDNGQARMALEREVAARIARYQEANGGQIPDSVEINRWMNSLMVDLTINLDGARAVSGRAMTFDLTGATETTDDDLSFSRLISAASNTSMVNSRNTGLTITLPDGTRRDIMTQELIGVRTELIDALNREPTDEEFWFALTRGIGF